MGYIISMPYFFFFFENPLWINLGWTSLYTVINLVMLFLIYLESRPVKLSDMEQKIYDRTFKSLKPKEFKHLMDHGSLDELPPDAGLVTRNTHLEKLMLVVEGQAEVVLRNEYYG